MKVPHITLLQYLKKDVEIKVGIRGKDRKEGRDEERQKLSWRPKKGKKKS